MNRIDYGSLVEWRCGWPNCAVKGPEGINIHHIIPVRIGGQNRGWNYWALCNAHHLKAEWGLSTKMQFDLKAQAEIAILGRTVDERSQECYNFLKSRGCRPFRHIKSDGIKESKAIGAGLKKGEIHIGSFSISLVEKTYSDIDRVLKRKNKKRATEDLG